MANSINDIIYGFKFDTLKRTWPLCLSIFIASTCGLPAHAMEAKQNSAATQARCEQYNTEDKSYLYGEGIFLNFGERIPPAHTPIKRDQPPWYGGTLNLFEVGMVSAGIPGKWMDPDASLYELKSAPLSIDILPNHQYSFCYRQVEITGSNTTHIVIDHPETIRLIRK